MPLTAPTTANGCTTLWPGALRFSASDAYFVRVERSSGTGAYSIELTRA